MKDILEKYGRELVKSNRVVYIDTFNKVINDINSIDTVNLDHEELVYNQGTVLGIEMCITMLKELNKKD